MGACLRRTRYTPTPSLLLFTLLEKHVVITAEYFEMDVDLPPEVIHRFRRSRERCNRGEGDF